MPCPMQCAQCGAALAPGATWCGLCYAQVAAPQTPPPPVYPGSAPYPVPPPAPGYTLPAPPTAPTVHDQGWDASAARVALAGNAARPEWTPPPAWPSPAWEMPPQAAAYAAAAPARQGAGWTTFAAIAAGAAIQFVLWMLLRDSTAENEALVRYALVGSITVYGVVGWLVVSRIHADGHPLRWRGSWGYLPSAVLGLAVGGGLAKLLLGAAHGAGAEGGDQVANVLVSEGDVPHILAAFLILVVAAPVIEELLFRGLLLSAFQHLGWIVALVVSSVAFAAWHLQPRSLVYYSLAGALLGALYIRKGLVSSMAAHAAFNGMLLLASISYALAPGPTVSYDGLTLTAPNGWHSVEDGPFIHLTGPSGGEVGVVTIPGVGKIDPGELLAKIQIGLVPEVVSAGAKLDTARTVDLPAGTAIRFQMEIEGRDGDLVILPAGGSLHMITMVSGGSQRVRGDFAEMLEGIQTG